MVQNDSLSHQFEGEESLQLRLSGENVRCDRDGENIALDSDIEVAHVMLMQSPPHRANILDPTIQLRRNRDFQDRRTVLHHRRFRPRSSPTTRSHRRMPLRNKPSVNTRYQKAFQSRGGSLSPNCGKWPATWRWTTSSTAAGKRGPRRDQCRGVECERSRKLPPNLKRLLAQPLSSGYSLGVCFAPSVAHPGGVYWLVMVIY